MLVAGVGCPGLQALNPVCQVGTVITSVGGTVAGAGIDAVLSGLSQWVASGAEWLLGQIGAVLFSTTSVNLGADWFRHNYAIMTALAGVVVLPLLLVSTLQAIFRQNPAQLLRAFLVQLPLALLLGVIGDSDCRPVACRPPTPCAARWRVAQFLGERVARVPDAGSRARRSATPAWPPSCCCWSGYWWRAPRSSSGSSCWCGRRRSTWPLSSCPWPS